MSTLNVTLVQTSTHWHDWTANQAHFANCLSAVPEGTDLVVLPEMFGSGFTMASREVAQTMQGPAVGWMREQARQHDATLCGSLVIEEGGEYYNRLLWVTPSGAIATYDKRHRFRMAGEHEYYAAGESSDIFQLGEWRVLPSVCYDLRFPVSLRNQDTYEVMVCVANWPAARQTAWDTLLRARAIENQCYCVGVNIVGRDGNDVTYGGGSAVIEPSGEPVLTCADAAGVYSCSLDLESLRRVRREFPVWQDADKFQILNKRGE